MPGVTPSKDGSSSVTVSCTVPASYPPAVAVMVTLRLPSETELSTAAIGKVAVAWPARTVVLAGTVAALGLEDERETDRSETAADGILTEPTDALAPEFSAKTAGTALTTTACAEEPAARASLSNWIFPEVLVW